MIIEDYVSYETAKLLKERGFNGECIAYYSIYKDNNASLHRWRNRQTYVNVKNDGYTIVPTLQMAMKWLREVHHLTIDVFHFRDWKVNIKTIPDDYFKADYSYPELKSSGTYEEACEAAIKYCLENLI